MPETAKRSRSSGYGVASRLSLAVKLYSIFALFAVLIAAIIALSGYNTHRNAELTEAIETANRAALNVERVNSLVYAVVMESRGVYMSTDAADREEVRRRATQIQRPDPGRGQKLGSASFRPMTPSNSPSSRSASNSSSTSARSWFAAASRSAPPRAANGATTMPIAPCVPPSTRISKRSPRSMPNAASGLPRQDRHQPRNGPCF